MRDRPELDEKLTRRTRAALNADISGGFCLAASAFGSADDRDKLVLKVKPNHKTKTVPGMVATADPLSRNS